MNDDTDWQTIAAALSTQLDAERELRKEAEARYSLMQTMEADELREQLEAEREKAQEAEHQRDKWEQIAEELEHDRDHWEAEREKMQALVDALMKIREKCANVGYCDGLVLPCDAVVVVIDDALAKVKEGK